MATSTPPRKHSRSAPRAKKAPVKSVSARVTPRRRLAGRPATAALKRFAALLRSVKSSAATLTAKQRRHLKKAIKHAHLTFD